MRAKPFWSTLAVQAVAVAVLFAAMLPLGRDFFESWGFLVGPIAWLACSYVTARVLKLPVSLALFSAVAGGVAGTIVLVVASNHTAGIVAALLVFGASCGGYDPQRDTSVGSAASSAQSE